MWAAGLTVTIKHEPTRVVAVTNSSEQDIDARMPSKDAIERYRRLFATGEKADGVPVRVRTKAAKRSPHVKAIRRLVDMSGELFQLIEPLQYQSP